MFRLNTFEILELFLEFCGTILKSKKCVKTLKLQNDLIEFMEENHL